MSTLRTGAKVDPRLQEARELYRKLISPEVEAANLDKFVAIDRESEDFEIGDDLIDVTRRLRSRRCNARIVGFRVCDGGGAVDRIGTFRISACLK